MPGEGLQQPQRKNAAPAASKNGRQRSVSPLRRLVEAGDNTKEFMNISELSGGKGAHPLAAVSSPASSLRESCASGAAVLGALERMSAAAAPAAAAAAGSPVEIATTLVMAACRVLSACGRNDL